MTDSYVRYEKLSKIHSKVILGAYNEKELENDQILFFFYEDHNVPITKGVSPWMSVDFCPPREGCERDEDAPDSQDFEPKDLEILEKQIEQIKQSPPSWNGTIVSSPVKHSVGLFDGISWLTAYDQKEMCEYHRFDVYARREISVKIRLKDLEKVVKGIKEALAEYRRIQKERFGE